MALSLVDELSFYRRYHHDKVNVLIHVICIPLILLSTMWQLARLNVPYELVEPLGIPAELAPYLNGATALAINFGQYYIRLDALFGIPAFAGMAFAAYNFSTQVVTYGEEGHKVAWIIFAFGWISQFIGHGAFEHRAPALLDNLNQALVLAPFFAFIEILYFLGIRKDIIDDIDKKILPEINEFHKKRLHGQKN